MINIRLIKINKRRREIQRIDFSAYNSGEDLMDGVRNYADNHRTLFRKGIIFSQEEIERVRKYYCNLRDTAVSLGMDLTGLPRRLKLLKEED